MAERPYAALSREADEMAAAELKRQRREARATQAEAAVAAGLPRPAVSEIERGARRVSAGEFLVLTAFYSSFSRRRASFHWIRLRSLLRAHGKAGGYAVMKALEDTGFRPS